MVLTHFRASSPPITSFTLRLVDSQILVGSSLIEDLLDAHGPTLRDLVFVNCSVAMESIRSICRRAVCLQRLELAVPVNDFVSDHYLLWVVFLT